MKLKKGDKVYCIKSLGGQLKFIEKDKFYIVEEATTYDKISHSLDNKEECDVDVVIICDNWKGRTAFTMERKLRKEKLDKINEKLKK